MQLARCGSKNVVLGGVKRLKANKAGRQQVASGRHGNNDSNSSSDMNTDAASTPQQRCAPNGHDYFYTHTHTHIHGFIFFATWLFALPLRQVFCTLVYCACVVYACSLLYDSICGRLSYNISTTLLISVKFCVN